jgi:hypothetical protein
MTILNKFLTQTTNPTNTPGIISYGNPLSDASGILRYDGKMYPLSVLPTDYLRRYKNGRQPLSSIEIEPLDYIPKSIIPFHNTDYSPNTTLNIYEAGGYQYKVTWFSYSTNIMNIERTVNGTDWEFLGKFPKPFSTSSEIFLCGICYLSSTEEYFLYFTKTTGGVKSSKIIKFSKNFDYFEEISYTGMDSMLVLSSNDYIKCAVSNSDLILIIAGTNLYKSYDGKDYILQAVNIGDLSTQVLPSIVNMYYLNNSWVVVSGSQWILYTAETDPTEASWVLEMAQAGVYVSNMAMDPISKIYYYTNISDRRVYRCVSPNLPTVSQSISSPLLVMHAGVVGIGIRSMHFTTGGRLILRCRSIVFGIPVLQIYEFSKDMTTGAITKLSTIFPLLNDTIENENLLHESLVNYNTNLVLSNKIIIYNSLNGMYIIDDTPGVAITGYIDHSVNACPYQHISLFVKKMYNVYVAWMPIPFATSSNVPKYFMTSTDLQKWDISPQITLATYSSGIRNIEISDTGEVVAIGNLVAGNRDYFFKTSINDNDSMNYLSISSKLASLTTAATLVDVCFFPLTKKWYWLIRETATSTEVFLYSSDTATGPLTRSSTRIDTTTSALFLRDGQLFVIDGNLFVIINKTTSASILFRVTDLGNNNYNFQSITTALGLTTKHEIDIYKTNRNSYFITHNNSSLIIGYEFDLAFNQIGMVIAVNGITPPRGGTVSRIQRNVLNLKTRPNSVIDTITDPNNSNSHKHQADRTLITVGDVYYDYSTIYDIRYNNGKQKFRSSRTIVSNFPDLRRPYAVHNAYIYNSYIMESEYNYTFNCGLFLYDVVLSTDKITTIPIISDDNNFYTVL